MRGYGPKGRLDPGREFAVEIDGLQMDQDARVLVNGNVAGGGATIFSSPLRSMRVTSHLRGYDTYFPASFRRADLSVRLTDGGGTRRYTRAAGLTASLACWASDAKAAGLETASSDRLLRSSAIPAFFSPLMNRP